MNRLTAIGLASLVAYGLLVTTKYMGVVSAAREDKGAVSALNEGEVVGSAVVAAPAEVPVTRKVSLPPLCRARRPCAYPRRPSISALRAT
jgi:hypothetical protein